MFGQEFPAMIGRRHADAVARVGNLRQRWAETKFDRFGHLDEGIPVTAVVSQALWYH